ncbi:hypothetical protein HYFRA_00013512 [Hymenoscyphus fraxineus]|uniref:Uncharacterized protein n=1 Tax=Hymenoscyphus fraxineus TaxID=746836 RepID=A0A9N9PNC3_9HELO|nr:hypothetical protein HYFRA_00013512 [Hymenoscyphus fraxineus]
MAPTGSTSPADTTLADNDDNDDDYNYNETEDLKIRNLPTNLLMTFDRGPLNVRIGRNPPESPPVLPKRSTAPSVQDSVPLVKQVSTEPVPLIVKEPASRSSARIGPQALNSPPVLPKRAVPSLVRNSEPVPSIAKEPQILAFAPPGQAHKPAPTEPLPRSSAQIGQNLLKSPPVDPKRPAAPLVQKPVLPVQKSVPPVRQLPVPRAPASSVRIGQDPPKSPTVLPMKATASLAQKSVPPVCQKPLAPVPPVTQVPATPEPALPVQIQSSVQFRQELAKLPLARLMKPAALPVQKSVPPVHQEPATVIEQMPLLLAQESEIEPISKPLPPVVRIASIASLPSIMPAIVPLRKSQYLRLQKS